MIGRSVAMVTILSVIGLFDQFVRSWKDFFHRSSSQLDQFACIMKVSVQSN